MRQKEVRSARGGGRRGGEVMKLKAQGRINVIMKVFHFVSALCIRKVSCGHVRYYSVEGVFSLWGLVLVGEVVQLALDLRRGYEALSNPLCEDCFRLDPQA